MQDPVYVSSILFSFTETAVQDSLKCSKTGVHTRNNVSTSVWMQHGTSRTEIPECLIVCMCMIRDYHCSHYPHYGPSVSVMYGLTKETSI